MGELVGPVGEHEREAELLGDGAGRDHRVGLDARPHDDDTAVARQPVDELLEHTGDTDALEGHHPGGAPLGLLE